MSNRKVDLLLKNLEMAILAMDTLDEMEISDETQIFDSTLRNKMFIQNIESEVLQSIFSSTSEKTMAYLKNSSYYLKDAMASLGIIASSGSLEGDVNLNTIKSDIIKGIASYVFFITALSSEFMGTEGLLDSLEDEKQEQIADTLNELKDMMEERDIFQRFSNLNYYEEKGLEVEMDNSDDDDTGMDIVWGDAIDVDTFKESN